MLRGSLYLLTAVLCVLATTLAAAAGDMYGAATGVLLCTMNAICCLKEDENAER